jgi:AraC-like DNA-binding protein
VELIFHYGDPWTTAVAGGEPEVQPESFAISMMRKYVHISPNGRTGFFSVRFFPWGAYHFFAEPIHTFLDATLDSKHLWPDVYTPLMLRFRQADTAENRLAIVQEFLLAQLSVHRKDEPQLEQALRLIREEKGQLSMAEICARTGLSKKQLERKFMARVGTTPKVFSRVTRFLNICHHLQDHQHKTLTEMAQDCGYFDQAHFIREFKEFSGYSPREFFARHVDGAQPVGITEI